MGGNVKKRIKMTLPPTIFFSLGPKSLIEDIANFARLVHENAVLRRQFAVVDAFRITLCICWRAMLHAFRVPF